MNISRLSFAVLTLPVTLSLLLLAGCTSTPYSSPALERRTSTIEAPTVALDRFAEPPKEERPGLATGWGERRDSRVLLTEFRRANGDTPLTTGRLYYDDRAGTQAMLARFGGDPTSAAGLLRLPGGFVSVGLQNEQGAWLEGWTANRVTHIVGEKGARYAVVVRNDTIGRLELVASVDGFDVLDGKPASFHKRGYMLNPGETYAIEGFRTGPDAVAAFRFSSVGQSYATLKHDDTRNVGVIGIAAFAEKNKEVERRRAADPFPRSWATPAHD